MVRILTATTLCLALHAVAHSAPQSTKASTVQEHASLKSRAATAKSVPARRISIGDSVPKAIQQLAAAGVKKESAWQMGPSSPDLDITWRDIEKGVTLAITYHVKRNKITNLRMMYIPPIYNRKGNIRFVNATSVEFHADGSYSVRYAKPSWRQTTR